MNEVTLVTNNKADCLERILQRTRHRGFAVKRFSMDSASDNSYRVTLEVSGQRPIGFLTTQLAKLHDILDVQVAASTEDANYVRSA